MSKFKTLSLLALLAICLFFSCKPEQNQAWKHNDNTLRVRSQTDLTTLNPFLYRTSYEATAFKLVFQFMMDFDPKTMELSPQLIKAAPTVADMTDGEYAGGQSFTYEILDEAVWDDGKPVTAADVEFSFKVLFNPKLPLQRIAAYLEFVREIQPDAGNQKKFTVLTSRKYLMAKEVISNFTILPSHIYDPEGLLKGVALKDLTNPATAANLADDPRLQQFADAFSSPKFGREVVSGSGPYQVVEWVDGQRVVFKKKENWWGDKLADRYPTLVAYPDSIIVMPIADQTAAIAALKDEAIDVCAEIDSKQFKELQQDSFVRQVYNLMTMPRLAYFYLAINNRNPKLSDKRVRRALAHVLDMDAVIRDLYDGFGERVSGPFLPDKPYYDKNLKPIEMNLDKARQLLTEAGWKDSNGNGTADKIMGGQAVELKLQYLYTPGLTFQENLSELMKNNAQKVGIEIERVQVESNVMGERLRNLDYELAGRGAGAQPVPDDPKQLWHTDSAQPGGSNYSGFGNAETDALIEQIQGTTDAAERESLYKRFQAIVYEEQPVIFLFSPMDKIAIHKRFEPVVSKMGVSLPHLKKK